MFKLKFQKSSSTYCSAKLCARLYNMKYYSDIPWLPLHACLNVCFFTFITFCIFPDLIDYVLLAWWCDRAVTKAFIFLFFSLILFIYLFFACNYLKDSIIIFEGIISCCISVKNRTSTELEFGFFFDNCCQTVTC